jgi:hypothetical protein
MIKAADTVSVLSQVPYQNLDKARICRKTSRQCEGQAAGWTDDKGVMTHTRRVVYFNYIKS